MLFDTVSNVVIIFSFDNVFVQDEAEESVFLYF